MFRVDIGKNRISKLKQVRFSDLGYTERNHLQEWLANQPDALGEELLIIQKEFDGFDDTKERLDLLAIDKQGALVIIENKLDDSGRNVVWQSLKYASYCSTLSKSQIAEIFQRYLDKTTPGTDAKALICEFLGQEEFADVVVNPGNDQRLIMVAAQFRKEVTSTVLWLLKHRVLVKCFRATPFQHGDSVYLNIEQVIPLPEAEELMIGISEKESEEQSSERGQVTRYLLRAEFWQKTLEALEHANVSLYSNVNPTRDHWLNAGSGLSGVPYTMIFNRDEARVELTIARASREENKALFDALYARRGEIEALFGEPLDWHRNDEKKASNVSFGKAFVGHDRESWPEMTEWLVDHLRRLHSAFHPQFPLLRKVLRKELVKEQATEAEL
ncbi:membrane protein [Lysobacter arseniciresistens ZS79]|uniref:Membrane protein n=2 Tax=Novilysobacter TaxID=3382699 RepID=A0A0A0F3C3_9GAMM|nr:membrane protein [Lysobacter arseniciresistens ZS79]